MKHRLDDYVELTAQLDAPLTECVLAVIEWFGQRKRTGELSAKERVQLRHVVAWYFAMAGAAGFLHAKKPAASNVIPISRTPTKG